MEGDDLLEQAVFRILYQSLSCPSSVHPPIHKHGVDLVTVTGHQLVPLAVKLWKHTGNLTKDDERMT